MLRTRHVPATSCPLNLTSTSCGMATRGVNEARKRRLPRGWTLHGTVPPFTSISRSPGPALHVSTVHSTQCKLVGWGFPNSQFQFRTAGISGRSTV